MAVASVQAGFKYLGGATRSYLNEKTGQVISRRQYDQLFKTGGNTLEAKAKLNKQIDPTKSVLRPAKGRSSGLKLDDKAKQSEAQKRLEKAATEKARQDGLKEQAKIARNIEQKKRRKVKVKKITARLLRPGDMGARLPFNDYTEYLELFQQAKSTGKIFGYGIGLEGIDERTGRTVTPTLFKLRGFDRVIDETTFEDETEDFLESHSYFIFTNYYMHLAFKADYAEKKKNDYMQKIGPVAYQRFRARPRRNKK